MILLNKVDLVSPADLAKIRALIGKINQEAEIMETNFCKCLGTNCRRNR